MTTSFRRARALRTLATAAGRPRRPQAILLASSLSVAVLAADVRPSWAGPGVGWINSVRAGHGLGALGSSGGLDGLAASHTRAMISRNSLFHTSNLGSSVSSVYSNWTRVGENVGVGSSLESVQSAFMNSSAHRANILGAYTVVGTAAISGSDGRVWVTQVFAAVPGTGSTAAAAPAPARTVTTAARTAAAPPPTAG
ncbi:MAG: hypothetical protein QOI20_423, partial [Acidimicrobiaceae bacterium]|nr:hypothetical protein [Acidimicrobiaceae bacterium]